ncbi:hypothetical protein LPB142_07930 [Rhodobacter xanthinilyticus]|uniref:diguanylate cyclase n=2 Tax=Rhodobacter xanthinilyticus TaxID=1850250 RepID=A0A1D9MBL2_9RHOB|nr:hypothetical protein LPB142_07930 [Rhodobacter xanthinilyticus]
MALALWSLLGATTGAAWMRPPIEGGLSHPVSALCLLLLGASVLVPAGLRRGVPVLAGGVLLMVAAGVAPRLTALAQASPGGLSAPGGIDLGTAVMIASLAVARICAAAEMILAAQWLVFLGIWTAILSLIGLVFDAPLPQGVMAPMTAVVGLLLATAFLARAPHRGILRAVLGAYPAGQQARWQMTLGVVGPVAIGGLFLERITSHEARGDVALVVVLIVAFYLLISALNALAFERSDRARRRLERERRYLAERDGLTGLFNRVKFEQRFAAASDLRGGRGVPFCFVLVDLDHFKQINDFAGHEFGDQVLRQVAQTLQAGVRPEDTLARLGGEEFAILLPGRSLAEGLDVAEALRARVAAQRFSRRGATSAQARGAGGARGLLSGQVAVTASLGVAEWSPGETMLELYSRADEALYAAKGHGRDRVVAAPPAGQAGAGQTGAGQAGASFARGAAEAGGRGALEPVGGASAGPERLVPGGVAPGGAGEAG